MFQLFTQFSSRRSSRFDLFPVACCYLLFSLVLILWEQTLVWNLRSRENLQTISEKQNSPESNPDNSLCSVASSSSSFLEFTPLGPATPLPFFRDDLEKLSWRAVDRQETGEILLAIHHAEWIVPLSGEDRPPLYRLLLRMRKAGDCSAGDLLAICELKRVRDRPLLRVQLLPAGCTNPNLATVVDGTSLVPILGKLDPEFAATYFRTSRRE